MTDSTDRDDDFEIEIERGTPTASGDTESGSSSTDGDRTRSPSRWDPPASPERRLEDELGRVDVSTTHDGFVEGHVVGFESIDDTTVRLEVALPHGGIVEFTLEKPIPWSEEFLLARIVDDVGYDATSISHLVGETVYLTRADLEEDTDGDWWTQTLRTAQLSVGEWLTTPESGPEWRLVDPRERRQRDEQTSLLETTAGFATILIVLAPLVTALGVAYALTGGLVLSGPVLGAMLAGVVLALIGASAFVAET